MLRLLKLASALTLLLGTSCIVIDADPWAPITTQITNNTITAVEVEWLTIDELSIACGPKAFGCAINIDGICLIRATKPKDFNDKGPLQVLGHELLHCLYWKHSNYF